MSAPIPIRPILSLDVYSKSCRKVVADVLNNKYISLCPPKDITDNKVLYILTAPGSTGAKAKYHYRVIPIFNSVEKIFWLGVSLEFQCRQGRHFLVGTSIIIFEGQPFDEEKIPLLRAEWELMENSRIDHAQPHWHVYTGRVNPQPAETTFEEEPIEFEADKTVDEFTFDNSWEEGQWFHFAMASQWHIGNDKPAYCQIDPENLMPWLRGCIAYTVDQLKWLYDKKN